MRRAGLVAVVAVGLAALPVETYAAPTPPPTAIPTTTARASSTPAPTRLRLDVAPIAEGSYTLGARWGAVGVWSRYFTGQVFVARLGTPVLAVRDGIVITSRAGDWAGNSVMIDHGASGITHYAHLSGSSASPGQRVRRGDVVGYVGMTGRTFGPHLYFAWYPQGADLTNPYTTKDPIPFLLAQRGASTPGSGADKDAAGGLAKTGT